MTVYDFAHEVSKIRPGDRVTVDKKWLCNVSPELNYHGFMFTSPDRVLDNIVGSAWEFRYFEDQRTGTVTFERLKEVLPNDTRSYVPPDYRHLYTVGPDGFYRRKK